MKNCWLIEEGGKDNHFVKEELANLENLHKNYVQFEKPFFTTWIKSLNAICSDEKVEHFIMRCGTTTLANIIQARELSDFFHPDEKINHEIIEKAQWWLGKIQQSVFYTLDNFDQKNYQQMNLPLLNADSQFVALANKENLQLSFDTFRFIKPTRDLKAFNAGVLNPGQTIEQFLNSQTHDGSYEDDTLMIAQAKNVMDEYRFFIAGDQVIASSQYRNDKKLEYRMLNQGKEHQKVMSIAQEYARLYQPADMFVMDIAREDNNTYSIIEYNSFNCAGFYAADKEVIVEKVEDYLSQHKYQKKMKNF
jgi:hypothetical protein